MAPVCFLAVAVDFASLGAEEPGQLAAPVDGYECPPAWELFNTQ